MNVKRLQKKQNGKIKNIKDQLQKFIRIQLKNFYKSLINHMPFGLKKKLKKYLTVKPQNSKKYCTFHFYIVKCKKTKRKYT